MAWPHYGEVIPRLVDDMSFRTSALLAVAEETCGVGPSTGECRAQGLSSVGKLLPSNSYDWAIMNHKENVYNPIATFSPPSKSRVQCHVDPYQHISYSPHSVLESKYKIPDKAYTCVEKQEHKCCNVPPVLETVLPSMRNNYTQTDIPTSHEDRSAEDEKKKLEDNKQLEIFSSHISALKHNIGFLESTALSFGQSLGSLFDTYLEYYDIFNKLYATEKEESERKKAQRSSFSTPQVSRICQASVGLFTSNPERDTNVACNDHYRTQMTMNCCVTSDDIDLSLNSFYHCRQRWLRKENQRNNINNITSSEQLPNTTVTPLLEHDDNARFPFLFRKEDSEGDIAVNTERQLGVRDHSGMNISMGVVGNTELDTYECSNQIEEGKQGVYAKGIVRTPRFSDDIFTSDEADSSARGGESPQEQSCDGNRNTNSILRSSYSDSNNNMKDRKADHHSEASDTEHPSPTSWRHILNYVEKLGTTVVDHQDRIMELEEAAEDQQRIMQRMYDIITYEYRQYRDDQERNSGIQSLLTACTSICGALAPVLTSLGASSVSQESPVCMETQTDDVGLMVKLEDKSLTGDTPHAALVDVSVSQVDNKQRNVGDFKEGDLECKKSVSFALEQNSNHSTGLITDADNNFHTALSTDDNFLEPHHLSSNLYDNYRYGISSDDTRYIDGLCSYSSELPAKTVPPQLLSPDHYSALHELWNLCDEALEE